jgi:hypothetical protein
LWPAFSTGRRHRHSWIKEPFEYLANEEAMHKEDLETPYYETAYSGGVQHGVISRDSSSYKAIPEKWIASAIIQAGCRDPVSQIPASVDP